MTDTVFQNWGGRGGGGGQFYLGKRMNKIEHEKIGTCARIEISQDADNTDQKVSEVHKAYKLLCEAFF